MCKSYKFVLYEVNVDPPLPPPKKPPRKTAYIYNTNNTFLDAGKNQLEVARWNVRVDLLEEYAK